MACCQHPSQASVSFTILKMVCLVGYMTLIITSIKLINPNYFTIVCAYPGSATCEFYYRNVSCRHLISLLICVSLCFYHCVYVLTY